MHIGTQPPYSPEFLARVQPLFCPKHLRTQRSSRLRHPIDQQDLCLREDEVRLGSDSGDPECIQVSGGLMSAAKIGRSSMRFTVLSLALLMSANVWAGEFRL